MKEVWETKKAWCLAALLLLFLCFAAWVGYPGPVIIEEPVENPPNLVVSAQEEHFSKEWDQGRWYYLNWYGHNGQRSKSSTSDQQWRIRQSDLTTADRAVSIHFALPPDEVAVARYNVADHSSDVCEVDENGCFALAEGMWTYRITANWTDKSRHYDGFARYFICIEKK